jgi:hypothetical protein
VRATPAAGGAAGDPFAAWGGSGQCFVTGNQVGRDVDGGPTRVASPPFDLSAGGSYEVSFARWFSNSASSTDAFRVQVSNDDGATWTTTVETVSGGGGGGWVRSTFRIEDLIPLTSQVRVRFMAHDIGPDSVVEAGVDDFRLVRRECGAPEARGKTRPTSKPPKAP